MAFLQINYYSKTLKKLVSFNALMPIDAVEVPGEAVEPKKQMKALYLLHGYSGNYQDWVSGSNIQELSLKHNLAVFMPSGENSFYLDDEDKGELFGEFIGRELVECTRKLFSLSHRREDTFIGGLSMGGYGAIRNGLKYNDTFGGVIALSSALIIKEISGIAEDHKDAIADYKYYRRVFGNLSELLGSDKDPEAITMKLIKEGKELPKIYMACGTEDFLLDKNRDYHNFLLANNVEHTYVEGPGDHNWSFWNEYIDKGIDWIYK
ncbi:MAG: alpha/beta hydrolase [Clostridiaceae bacterium]